MSSLEGDLLFYTVDRLTLYPAISILVCLSSVYENYLLGSTDEANPIISFINC